MSPFTLSLIVATGLAATAIVFGLALLWRIGAWQVRDLHSLHEDEGVSLGKRVPDVAVLVGPSGDAEDHLEFQHRATFVVFGQLGCAPCLELLQVAARHPATTHADLVYLAGDRDADLSDADDVNVRLGEPWRVYRFAAEALARRQWNVAVSPYFHLLDPDGRVLAKGVGSRPEHLDRMLTITPPQLGDVTYAPTSSVWTDLALTDDHQEADHAHVR